VTATLPGGYTDTALLTIIYTAANVPAARITCDTTPPEYILQTGEPYTVDLDDIFDFTGPIGTVNSVSIDPSGEGLSASLPNANEVTLTATQQLSGPFEISITSLAPDGSTINSESCEIEFLNLGFLCDNPTCEPCGDDFICLRDAGCLQGNLLVLDPFVPLNLRTRYSALSGRVFDVTNAHAGPLSLTSQIPISDTFDISPSTGDEQTTFEISSPDTIGNNNQSAAIFELEIAGYENNEAKLCIGLTRQHYDIGGFTYDPETPLLITGSRSVIGFYEMGGYIFSNGPYIFTAKVWLRE
jgi:hypothetical protein